VYRDSLTNPSASVHFQSRQCRPTGNCQRFALFLLYLTALQRPGCRTLQDMSPPSQRRQQGDRRRIPPAVLSSWTVLTCSTDRYAPYIGLSVSRAKEAGTLSSDKQILWQSDRCCNSCGAVNLLTERTHQQQSETKTTNNDLIDITALCCSD